MSETMTDTLDLAALRKAAEVARDEFQVMLDRLLVTAGERDDTRQQLAAAEARERALREAVTVALADERCISDAAGVIETCAVFSPGAPEHWCLVCKLRAALAAPAGEG